jgi:uncharacterized protein (TIGR02246 family)
MQRHWSLIAAAVFLIATDTGYSQDNQRSTPRPSQEIRKLLERAEDSFSRGDAAGLADCWTASGDFAGPGGDRIEGRENIEKVFREFFATHKDQKLKLHVASFRMVGDDLVLLDAVSETKPEPAEGAGESSLLSLVLLKRDGHWLIESARETGSSTSPPGGHLKILEWMVGNWAEEASPQSGLSVRSTCDWTANQSFLIRKFKVEGRADLMHAGTEVIGWDPVAHRIRSWVFDSDGGFGENAWVKDGNRWLVRHFGTRPDGSEISATNILTLVDADTVFLQSKDRTVNGQRQPDVPAITIKRQRAAKAKPSAKEPAQPQPRHVLPQP